MEYSKHAIQMSDHKREEAVCGIALRPGQLRDLAGKFTTFCQ